MDYQTMLAQDMQLYPMLFPNEAEWLRHVFFVLGNGLEWQDGQLVDRVDGRPFEVRLAEKQAADQAHEEKRRQEQRERHAFLVKECARAGLEPPPYADPEPYPPVRSTKIFPLSDGCLIADLPDDITPDWLAAAKKALVVAKTLKRTKRDNTHLKAAQRRIKEVERRRRPTEKHFKIDTGYATFQDLYVVLQRIADGWQEREISRVRLFKAGICDVYMSICSSRWYHCSVANDPDWPGDAEDFISDFPKYSLNYRTLAHTPRPELHWLGQWRGFNTPAELRAYALDILQRLEAAKSEEK